MTPTTEALLLAAVLVCGVIACVCSWREWTERQRDQERLDRNVTEYLRRMNGGGW